ncbi:MAG: YtxH domain-containing protein [Nitrospirae bacterium]|nr:YtxH domain-containing protein [Nitrospirota bacterium]
MTEKKCSSSKSGNTGAFVALAAAFGGIIGAAAGLMFAPQPGKDSRDQVRKAYDGMVDNINDFVHKVDEHLPDIITKIKDEVSDIPEQLKMDIKNISKDTEDRFNTVLEKGAGYVSDMNKSVTASIEEGVKKFKEVSDKLSRN